MIADPLGAPERDPGSLGQTYRSLARVGLQWRRRPAMIVGACILGVIVLVAFGAPAVWPFNPGAIYGRDLMAPSSTHWLGLDYSGHDVVSWIVWGGRGSLTIGLLASLIALVIGGLVGLTGGYFGGWIDLGLAFVTDFFLVIPVLPLMITLAVLYGSSELELILIIGFLSWMPTARVLRAQSRSQRERLYVRRARSFGAGHVRTIATHIVPPLIPLLVATATLATAYAIFAEASLSFLGLGDFGVPSWGNMIALNFNGGAVTAGAWWAIVTPGAAIAIVVVSLNTVGRGIEAALNPRLRGSHLGATFRLVPAALSERQKPHQAGTEG